eukprot:g14087.t1
MNLKAIGVEIPEAGMVQLILRQLSEDFDVEKRTLFVTDPEISRAVLEQQISAAYSVRKANSLGKQSMAAAPAAATDPAAKNNPHALAVGQGDGFRQGVTVVSGVIRGAEAVDGVAVHRHRRNSSSGVVVEELHRSGGIDRREAMEGLSSSSSGAVVEGLNSSSRYWSPPSPRQQQAPPWNPSLEVTAAYRDWYTAFVSWHKSWKQEQQQQLRSEPGPPAPHGPPTSPRRSAMSPPPPPPPPNYHMVTHTRTLSLPRPLDAPRPLSLPRPLVDLWTTTATTCRTPAGGAGPAPLPRGAGGDEGYEETSVGPVKQQSEPASEERRVTFQEGPATDEGEETVYEEENPGDWNTAVEARNRGEDIYGQRFAAALSLPFGAATAGQNGDMFHPGFMALRPMSEGACVCKGDGGVVVDDAEDGGGAPEPSAEGRAAGEDVSAIAGSAGDSAGAQEAAPVDGEYGRKAAVPETADREAESGGSLGPPPLPPEKESRRPPQVRRASRGPRQPGLGVPHRPTGALPAYGHAPPQPYPGAGAAHMCAAPPTASATILGENPHLHALQPADLAAHSTTSWRLPTGEDTFARQIQQSGSAFRRRLPRRKDGARQHPHRCAHRGDGTHQCPRREDDTPATGGPDVDAARPIADDHLTSSSNSDDDY